MKRYLKFILIFVAAAVLSFAILVSGCSDKIYVVSVIQTESGVKVTYSDGTTSFIEVSDGKDGEDVSIAEIYNKYIEETGENITYAEFLQKYLTLTASDSAAVAGGCLQSVAKIYCEFIEKGTKIMGMYSVPYYDVNMYTGSAVIWDIDGIEDGYTYLVTNYHVVYDGSADSTKNGGYLPRNIYLYLYGSESSPYSSGTTDENGYTVYDYGSYAVECEYVGGTVTSDIAVIKAKTEDLKAVNENIKAVTLAADYHVGETAIAIGNPENEGISVTEGIISVENENIVLAIDGTGRRYRSIRIDTALYSGNSGGGLFNAEGELIGITNAGDSSDQNVNYAVPLEIVKGTVENILYYATDGDDGTTDAYKIVLGITLVTQNSKYVYDYSVGYGKIYEEAVVYTVNSGSIAATLGLKEGDIINSIGVNGKDYPINRSFDVSDLLLTVRAGNAIKVNYTRDGVEGATAEYLVLSGDLVSL